MDQAHLDPKKQPRVQVEADETFNCEDCGVEVNKAVAKYSKSMTGKVLCKDCQTKTDEVVEENIAKDEKEDTDLMDVIEDMGGEEMKEKKVSTAPKGIAELKKTVEGLKK